LIDVKSKDYGFYIKEELSQEDQGEKYIKKEN